MTSIKKNKTLQTITKQSSAIDFLERKSSGMAAWLLHRISGLGLTFYLLLHIPLMSILMINGESSFNNAFDVLHNNKIFIIFDLIILAGLVFHTLNGIRLIIIDSGLFLKFQKNIFIFICIISVIVCFFLLKNNLVRLF